MRIPPRQYTALWCLIAALALPSCKPGEFNVVVLTPIPKPVSTHNGWTKILAVGAVSPVSQASMTTSSAYVTLSWNASSVKNGSIETYRLFRSTAPGASQNTDYYATDLSAVDRTFTDTSVVAGRTYYYTVSPMVGGQAIHAENTGDYEVKVVVPPANMALVHRWAANKEMCELMGRTPDRSKNYRCPYGGPGAISGYFDLGSSRLIDLVETGCNYTPSPGCGSVANGCLGTAAPGAVGSDGDVFYNRTNGTCYVKVAGAWTAANSTLSASNRALLASSKPGLPPLVSISQNEAWNTCIALTEGGFGAKRLLRRQEQILASAWSSVFTDAEIATIEGGTTGVGNGRCNSSGGSGLTYDNLVTPANLETLPGTLAGNLFSVRTGSSYSVGCKSMYGIQDLVGNVWEWASDQLGACSAVSHTCTGAASSLDPGNTLWSSFHFDGTIGPGGSGVNVTDWDFSAMSFSATQILLPLGLPVVGAAASSLDAIAIGTGSGQFNPTKFHGDRIYVYTDNGGTARGALSGGSFYEGVLAGRYTMGIDAGPTDSYNMVGMRCALDAD